MSPLRVYKNIENNQNNIVDLLKDLKKVETENEISILILENNKESKDRSMNKNDINQIKQKNKNDEDSQKILKLPQKNNLLKIQLDNEKIENHLIHSDKSDSHMSIKSNEEQYKSTKTFDLSTVYEYYQKELNKFNAKKENARRILKFTNLNFKDMKENKRLKELHEIPEFDLLNFGLIIEGDAIIHCLDDEVSHIFWKLIKKSRSIICCRCNPIQKSQIVNFVKNKSSQICLAIGDGGNDVNMIKASNVGVGIFGKEGYQAAFSSDYAISEFKYLRRLLFYHGRYFILRNSYFVYFFLYKSLIFNVPNLWFAFFSGFSGTLIWDSLYFMLYTSLLTTMPPVVPMVFGEDLDIEMKRYPNKEILLK